MKKLLSILMLLVAIVTGAKAGDTYTLNYTNGSASQSTANYFKVSGSSKSSVSYTYNGTAYTKGFKLNSSGTIKFTNLAEATVTILQVTNTTKTLKFDGTAQTIASASTVLPTGDSGYRIYTLSNIATGEHTISYGDGESCIFFVSVEYTGSVMTQLDAPEITATGAGVVTIGAVEHATKVTYTTDGTDPTAESTTYTSSFNVADGTIVKAIAIGDGDSYANSDVTSKTVYLEGVTCATPTFNVKNGTVAISTTTPDATIEYNTDGGDSYTAYTVPLTFFESTTVYARAKRTGATTSDVASQAGIVAPAATAGSSSLTMYYNTTDMTAASATPKGLTGKADTDYEGWGITLNSTEKNLDSGNDINSKKSLKGSNGVQVKITMPEGVKANRVTIYSYNNADITNTSLWSEVAGTTYTDETEIGLESRSASTPDVRVFALDDVSGTITLNNNGQAQQCFIAVVDYIVPVVPSISAENVNIAKEATNEGEIAFTVENPVEGGVVTAAEKEEADWLTLGAVAGGKVAFTATANTTSSARVATVTLTYTYNTNETVTKDVTITQAPEIDGTVIIRSDITGNSASSKAATGTIGGTTSYSLENNQVEGGYKFNKNAYVSLTLTNGTFKTGDIINIYITKECDMTGNIIVYGSTADDVLYNTEVQGIVGENVFVLPEAVNDLSTISIRRTGDNAWNAYVKYIEVTRSGEKVSIINLNSKGYATYSKATDFEYAGADAYGMKLTATSLSGTKVTTGKIKAGEGILFKGAPNANVMITETTGAEEISDNDLMGTTPATGDAPTPDYANHKYFVLKGNQFVPYKTASTFAANKAYFEVEKEFSLNSIPMPFADETTAVEAVAEAKVNVNVPVKVIKNGQLFIGNYNVAGQQVK